MIQAVLEHEALTAPDKQTVLDATLAYDGTWTQEAPEQVPHEEPGVSSTSREWKFHAAQLTYNSKEGEWALLDKATLQGLFERLVDFAQALGRSLNFDKISVTMEESTATQEHVHAHIYFNSETVYHRRSLEPFTFEGIRPHVVPNRARGNAFAGAVRHGHFYVVAEKKGTLFTWTNFEPFAAYQVEAWWVDNLFKQEKLTREVYLSYAKRLGVGFARRLADVRAVERYEKEQAMHDIVRQEQEDLAQHILPMKTFPVVEEFLACFAGEPRHRRPILAIVGGTNLGKSMLAANVIREVGKLVGPSGVLEITVECNEHLDLVDFDPRDHAGVILDGVGDAMILKKNREALQGRAKLTKGGQSATNMYSYVYTFCKRAVVATFDLSAQNLEAFKTDHWLSNHKNVLLLELCEKAFVEPEVESVPVPNFASTSTALAPSPASSGESPRKRRWTNSPAATRVEGQAALVGEIPELPVISR